MRGIVQNYKGFTVRMPDQMRDRLKAAAQANNRSMNDEVLARLEPETLEIPSSEIAHLLNSIDLRLQALEGRR